MNGVAYRLDSGDPFHNLGMEEALCEAAPPGTEVLTLYINRPCVVVGRHQNPLLEVRLDELHRRGWDLVRRSSGGGTVWHGPGNLNWGLVVPKADYDRYRVTQRIASALGDLGRTLEATPQGDLFFDGRKVSGSAAWVRRDRVLHHGTLLCQADLDALRGVLGPTPGGAVVESVAVASRRASVTNLGLGVDEAAEALVAAWGGGAVTATPEVDWLPRAQALADPGWIWDSTPPFVWEGPTPAGPARLRIEAGRVVAAEPLGGRDRSLNMSKILGKRFFDPEFQEYIPTEEGP